MSNAFTNFLNSAAFGLTNNPADMKDYQHADRLYVKNTYARAPKFGWLYYIVFNINKSAVNNLKWLQKDMKDVGLLVKRMDLPRFKITPETLNQYNRKTIIQTKLTYEPISVDFHDDNSDITTNLWRNYYQYYYADSIYGEQKTLSLEYNVEFSDTKFKDKDYAYGYNNNPKLPFFTSIDIYVLHQQKFTKMTLVNPIVTDWAHDTVNQDENKIMASKMTLAYESVNYAQGKIQKGHNPPGFATIYYDTQPSPLSISGGIPGTIFGSSGIIAGASSIFGADGTLANAKSPLDLLGVALQTRNLAKGIGQINGNGLKTEGYSIISSALSGLAATGNQPGGGSAINRANATLGGLNQSGYGIVGNIGINLFASKNSSINGSIATTPYKSGT